MNNMNVTQTHAPVHEKLSPESRLANLRRIVEYFSRNDVAIEEIAALARQYDATPNETHALLSEILTRRREPVDPELLNALTRHADPGEHPPEDTPAADAPADCVATGAPTAPISHDTAPALPRYVAFPSHLFGQVDPVEMAVIQAIASRVIRPYDRASRGLPIETTVTYAWLVSYTLAGERTVRDAIRRLEHGRLLRAEMAGRDGIRLVLAPSVFLPDANSRRRDYAPVPSTIDGRLAPNERAVLASLLGLCGSRIFERSHAGEPIVADANLKTLAGMTMLSRATVRRTLRSLASAGLVTYGLFFGPLLGEFTISLAVLGNFGTVPNPPGIERDCSKSADHAAEYLHVHEREIMKERPAAAASPRISILDRFRIFALVASAFRPDSRHRTDIDRARIGKAVNALSRMSAGMDLVRDVIEHLQDMCRRSVPPERVSAEVARLLNATAALGAAHV